MNLRHETASLAHAGIGALISLLVMAGIAGTVYKVIAPGGWVAQAFGHSFKAGLSVLIGVALLLGFFYFSRTWTPSPKHRNLTANAVVFVFAIAGFAYLAHYWVTGTL